MHVIIAAKDSWTVVAWRNTHRTDIVSHKVTSNKIANLGYAIVLFMWGHSCIQFSAVQNSSIGDLVTDWLTDWGYFYFWHTKSDPRDLWPLRHLIRVMRRHDLSNKKTMTMTMTKTISKTISEHPQSTILESCDLWDLRPDWWDMTWPRQTMTMTMTIREHPQGANLETCDLWDTEYISDNWEQQSQHS